jgi:hypothetical protein
MHGNAFSLNYAGHPGQAHHRRGVIRAELSGDTCAALGITAQSSSPVLALCRQLIEAGHDPSTPLEVYRGETLALRIRSIGEAAGLEVNSAGTGFKPSRQPRPAPLVRQNRRVAG